MLPGHDFLLDPEIVFLNHGSYGACPRPVFERYQEWQRELEARPVEFLGRRFDDLVEEALAPLAAYVGAAAEDLVFVPNTTAGLNAVIRSLPLEAGDEVLTTTDEYGALQKTWEFVGARLRAVAPEELAGAVTETTRVVFCSHITSPTARLVDVEAAVVAARSVGALAIVDGAHAPGHVELDLEALGADIYAGNCHKWLCAPKGSAFLWAKPEHQRWIAPLVVSWGYGESTSFHERHGWQGTRDPAALLTVPAAIEYAASVDLERAHAVAQRGRMALPPFRLPSAPRMWATALPPGDPEALQRRLFDEHRIEVPVFDWEGHRLLRVSIGPYNDDGDLDALLAALADEGVDRR